MMKNRFLILFFIATSALAEKPVDQFQVSYEGTRYSLSFPSKNTLHYKSYYLERKLGGKECAELLVSDLKTQFKTIYKKSKQTKGNLKNLILISHNGTKRYLPTFSSGKKKLLDFPKRAMSLNKEIEYLCKK